MRKITVYLHELETEGLRRMAVGLAPAEFRESRQGVVAGRLDDGAVVTEATPTARVG